MLAASLYVMACSARNRLRVRLRRLKEPRYLIGAIVGAAYLYFSVFARMRPPGRAGRRSLERARMPAALQIIGGVAAPLVAMGLLAITAVSWILPFDSGLLKFSEAEIALLFPAPVSRRQLLVYRMVRSQLGLLLSALFLGLVTPSVAGFTRLRTALAMWLILFTGKVYFTGVALARSRLRSEDPAGRRYAWLPAAIVFAAALIVGRGVYVALTGGPLDGFSDIVDRLARAGTHGAAGLVLWPFVALVRPVFTASTASFVSAMAGGAVVLAAAIVWVLSSADGFDNVSAEAADRGEVVQAATGARTFNARVAGPALALRGRPEAAFAWKGAMQMLRGVDRRGLARLVAIAFAVTMAAVSIGRGNGLIAILGVFAAIGAGFAILMGPQALRADLRQDLVHLELLKTWPVASAAVVRGEMLWPAALLTIVAWACVGIALLLSEPVFGKFAVATRIAAAAAVAIVAPALILAQYTIHNGVALMFPAWVPLGAERPRGLDAMGQRLILLGGTWLLLAAMALPAAIGGGLVWLGFRLWIGTAALVPGAALAAAIIVVEVLVASEALGPLFDRVDLAAVEKSE